MALKRSRDKYSPDIYVDPSTTITLDMDDPQDVTTAAEVTRLKRDRDYDGLVELHAAHPLFSTKRQRGPIKVDDRIVYIMVDSNGVESKVRDTDALATMKDSGFKVDRTEVEDIMG